MRVLKTLKSFFAFLLWASVPKFDVSNVAGNALIKLSSIGITNLSGKAGGSVYAHNRGGSYVRNFAVPSNPQTAAQGAARAAFGSFASKWRALTEEERSAWRAAAENFPYIDRFGDEKVMSGENLYISLNRNLQIQNQSEITTPPTPQGVDGILSAALAAEIDTGNQSLILEGVELASNEAADSSYAIYATPAMSAGISYAKNKFRYITSLDEAEIVTQNDLIIYWAGAFGSFSAGSKIFVRIDPINNETGERGASYFVSAIVAEIAP